MQLLKRFLVFKLLIIFLILFCSCNDSSRSNELRTKPKEFNFSESDPHGKQGHSLRLSQFIRRIFEDKNGNMWFGTNGDGVIRFDGDTLQYYSIGEGLGGSAIRGILEDRSGNIWFGTDGGITKFDSRKELFTNFNEDDGLINNGVWSILIDRNEIFWIGTGNGISNFDGVDFSTFEIAGIDHALSSGWIHSITEDSKGQIWFGTEKGAYKYNPDSGALLNLSVKDGLSDNRVNDVVQDKNGTYWIATHFGLVSRWNGERFSNVSIRDSVKGGEVYDLQKDRLDNIWFPVEGYGIYQYDGSRFINFHDAEGINSDAIQSTYQDSQGRIWAGGYGGLWRYDPSLDSTDGNLFINITKEGPWD